jgi:hypothetical protein
MIQEVLAITNNEARQHQVWARAELAAALPPVEGDRVQLQQVILNLVMNGIEAMKTVTDRQRELLITSRSYGSGKVLVAVKDSGIGLDALRVERLFEAFYTTKPEGMGMGLSISRSIITAPGGELTVTPNSGPGATFQFTLPTRAAGPYSIRRALIQGIGHKSIPIADETSTATPSCCDEISDSKATQRSRGKTASRDQQDAQHIFAKHRKKPGDLRHS